MIYSIDYVFQNDRSPDLANGLVNAGPGATAHAATSMIKYAAW